MTTPLQRFLGRGADRPLRRPPDLLFAFDDRPSAVLSLGLALQILALQSVFFIVPVAAAGAISADVGEISRFLALSILACAAMQLLQALRRGPIGAGYPLAASPAAIGISVAAIAGANGAGFGGLAAATLLAGLAAILLTFAMARLRALLPDEVSGVVVLMIGVTLAAVATQRLGLHGTAPPEAARVGVALGAIALMGAIGLTRRRIGVFAVLLGAALATPVALALGHAPEGATDALAAAAWLALPRPFWPDFAALSAGGLGALLVSLIALKATTLGALVLLQRAADARWSRPDVPPLRRGLLAHGAGLALTGLIGASPAVASTTSTGVAIATGTLALRILWVNAALLTALAFSPKLVALFVLVPAPVQAAMLFFVAGFVAAQGAQLLTTRLLDRRRMLVAALGVSAGLAAAFAPAALLDGLPSLASPIALGASVAFLLNLLTLPLVGDTARLDLPLDAAAGRTASAWIAQLGGGWALKPETARAADQAAGELLDLLAEQRVATVRLDARRSEARITLRLSWEGAPLPAPSRGGSALALLGADDERRAYSVWLAARAAQRFGQAEQDGRVEARLDFDD